MEGHMRSRALALASLAALFCGIAAAGLLDRTGDEGTYLTYIGPLAKPDLAFAPTGATVAFVELSNDKFRGLKNSSYEALAFDLTAVGSVFAHNMADFFAERAVFAKIFDVDKSVLVAYDATQIAADHGMQLVFGGALVDASADLIPLSLMRITVPDPRLKMTIRLWVKDASGKELWAKEYSVEAKSKPLEKWGAYRHSSERKDIKKQLEAMGKENARMYEVDLYYSDTISDMLTEALGRVLQQGLNDLKASWSSITQAIPPKPDGGAASATEREELVEYGYVPVKVRGRKWEGEQGLLRIDLEHSKVKNDQVAFRVVCDGKVVDEGLVGAYRVDTNGHWSKDVFATFSQSFDLALPLGKRTVTFFLDQPDMEAADLAKLNNAGGEAAATTKEVRGKSTKRKQVASKGFFVKVNGAAETSGVIEREVEVLPNQNKLLSVYRNLYVLKEERKGLMDLLFLGSGTHYFGSWEASYRSDDPFEYLAKINWEDPKLAGLLSDKAGARKKACKVVREEKYTPASAALIETMALDSDDDVREEAIKAFIAIDDPKAVYFLVRTMIWDPEEDVRERAFDHLVKNKRMDAVPYLEEYYYSSAGTAFGQSKKGVKKPIRKALEKITGKEYPKIYSWWE
jgi:hypothetical protein